MNYEVFKAVITNRIKEFLPPIFHSCKVESIVVRKVNEEKDTLLIVPQPEGNLVAMPNIYLDDMYQTFQKTKDITEVLKMIAELVVQHTGSFLPDEIDLHLRERKNSIVMNLINTKRNKELLKEVPHRNILDLSIIYRMIIQQLDNGFVTVLVNNWIMDELDVNQQELDQLANENTSRMFPPEIYKMADFLYVMSNKQKFHGATTMVCEDAMEQLTKQIGSNFYLIPSSTHEVLAVPEEEGETENLLRLLEQGNRMCNTQSEILSDAIYFYDVRKKELNIAV